MTGCRQASPADLTLRLKLAAYYRVNKIILSLACASRYGTVLKLLRRSRDPEP